MSYWWEGKKLDQMTHEQINARHYPGTRELCIECGSPTGRAGKDDDSIYIGDHGPLCETCRDCMCAV